MYMQRFIARLFTPYFVDLKCSVADFGNKFNGIHAAELHGFQTLNLLAKSPCLYYFQKLPTNIF